MPRNVLTIGSVWYPMDNGKFCKELGALQKLGNPTTKVTPDNYFMKEFGLYVKMENKSPATNEL